MKPVAPVRSTCIVMHLGFISSFPCRAVPSSSERAMGRGGGGSGSSRSRGAVSARAIVTY